MNAAEPLMREPEPIEIDPRPEEQFCALSDDNDDARKILSPEEIAEEIERVIYLRASDLVEKWERADPRDCWRHTGEQPPREVGNPTTVQPYRTPQATIDAFWYIVGLCNPVQLTAWLEDHPKDAPFLLKLLEGK
jgi:hypothetical protein